MKYLKLFDSYRNKEILDEVEDIKLILQDFKDDYSIFDCVVDVEFVQKGPKNSISSFFVKGDHIQIELMKKRKSRSINRYELDSEFNSSEIKNEINRILDIYRNNTIEFLVCVSDSKNTSYGFLRGKWSKLSEDEFMKIINNDQKLIGIDIRIYLDIDQKFESIEYTPLEIEETIEYIKDIYSEIDDEFSVKIIPQNIEAKDFRHIDVQIFKKSNIPYKIDNFTGAEVEDWVKYKPSKFKLSEIMSTILTSKSFIESIDGVISKIWMQGNNEMSIIGPQNINELINRPSRFLPGKKAWEVLEIKQINIKYSI